MRCSTEKFLPDRMILEFTTMDRHVFKVTALRGFTGIKWGQESDGEGLPQVLGNKIVLRVAQVKFIASG